MEKRKRKRLEAAGWRIGSTAEFLSLSDEEAAIVEVKLALATALREQRGVRGMTQAQLGRLLGSSQSRVAKMEAADPSVTIDLMVRSLLRWGLPGGTWLSTSQPQDAAARLEGLKLRAFTNGQTWNTGEHHAPMYT